jgi:competence protein ComEA
MQVRSDPQRWIRLAAYGLIVVATGLVGFSIRGFLGVGEPSTAASGVAADLPAEWGAPEATNEFAPLEPPPAPSATHVSTTPDTVVVYISGAVAQPDTYQLPAEARFNDVVRLAGGLTEDADRDRVNLSERLHDAQHIHIPRMGEQTAGDMPGATEANPSDGRINLNTATLSELDSLPRIGKVLAQRIIDWRTSEGPFTTTDAIQQVSGITPSIYDEIKDKITVQ